jgi:hypothetical protein
MKKLCAIVALAALVAPLSAGEPGSWQVEPPGEGSAETYVYTSSHGRFVAGPNGSAIWVVYDPQKPRNDGSCTFDSCIINVTLNGKEGYEQEWVRFAFSNGSKITVRPNIRSGQYNVSNDFARVRWPEVATFMRGLRGANWVDVTFADGNMRRFSLAGSSAAFARGAAAAGAE